MSDQLEIKCDNNELYRRCTSIQIRGIEVPEHESNDNVMAVVKSCHEKINQIVYRPCTSSWKQVHRWKFWEKDSISNCSI